MENRKEEKKWRKIGIGAGIAVGVVLLVLLIVRFYERAAYDAEMQRLEAEYEKSGQIATQDASQADKSKSGNEKPDVDMTDEYSYSGNAAANLYHSYEDGKLAKMTGDETVYYYADNYGNLYRKSLSDSEWEIVIQKEGFGKNIFDLNVDNISGQYVYYKYKGQSEGAHPDNGIYRLNVETLEEELVVSDEGRGEPREPRLMNGKLYYLRDLDRDMIYCMDLETLKEEILFEPTEEKYYSIYDFSVTGNEIIFSTLDSVVKLTLNGELSVLYEELRQESVILCDGRLFFMDYESGSVYELDYDGNLTGTYEIKEPYVELIYVKDGYLYGYKYAGDNMLIKVHMETGNQEVVLDYPEDMGNPYFINIVDDTILLELCNSTDAGFLTDLYALPADAVDMALEDCVHLQQITTVR